MKERLSQTPEDVERAQCCLFNLQYGDLTKQERKNLLNEMRSIPLDSSFWTAAALVAKDLDLKELCFGKAVQKAKEEEIPVLPLMEIIHSSAA